MDPHKYGYILNGDPEPEPATGTLIVNSSPKGAAVYLDGKKTGLKTPVTINKITEEKKQWIKQEEITNIKFSWHHR